MLNFKDRRREVWGRSYTELFFLDEPTAFAAGHRPCFQCRRKDAQAFAKKWREVHRYHRPPYAAEMDNVLHAERLRGRVKRLHRRNIDDLPDGAFAALDGAAFAVRGDTLSLDAGWLRCSRVAAASHRCRRPHPANDNRSPVRWL